MFPPAIEHLAVDLVRQDSHMRVIGKSCDKGVNLGAWDDPSCGIGRAVDDDQPRGGCDLCQHRLGGKDETLFFFKCDGNGSRPCISYHGFVYRKARVRIHDLNSRLTEHQHGEEHRGLASGHNDDIVRVDLDCVTAMQVGGHRLSQGRDTIRRRVAMMPVA